MINTFKVVPDKGMRDMSIIFEKLIKRNEESIV